ANVAVKVPAALQESPSLPWRITQYIFPRPSLLSSDQWQPGMLPLFSSRVGSAPSSDIKKDNSGVVGGDPKPCCNCLGRDTIANAAARVGPAVVNLSVPQGFYGITNGKSIGSGTIIDQDGTILTCAHVVVDFQGMRGSVKGKVDVTLQDGRTFEGTVVNADLHSDIAIVKIHSKTPLPTATLGSSSKLRPGDWVVAMGCPLSLQNTITAGIVSCVDRKSSDLGLGGIRREYLQTDCAINVDVTLQDGRTFEGTVVNADLHSDIAIVKIHSKTPLPTATLGSSSKLRPGDWVVAMGCPLSLQNTITAGIVSCVDRKSSDLGLGGIRREYLQTDCAINAGNSGGPLVNVDGEIIGVNIMKVLAADGLSFAVPVDSVSKIIQHFKKSGRVVRPWLGLKMVDLNEMIIAQLKERDNTFPNVNKGVLVPMVTPGSPADRAGFRPGDVVIEFDGKPVESIKEIIEIMGDRVGVPMKVALKRAKDNLVTLTVIPEESKSDM
ncbi:putative protease do-like 14, partial [Quercus suber]